MTSESKTDGSGPRKRLALFFDGTWNEPPDHTDESVWRMCQRSADFRPLGLKEWATRTGRNLEQLIADPGARGGVGPAASQRLAIQSLSR